MKSKKQKPSAVPAPVTMSEIVATVQGVVSRSVRSIRDDLATLGIQPIGKRQCPQRYAANTPWRVLYSLGYPVDLKKLALELPPADTAAARIDLIARSAKAVFRAPAKRKATR